MRAVYSIRVAINDWRMEKNGGEKCELTTTFVRVDAPLARRRLTIDRNRTKEKEKVGRTVAGPAASNGTEKEEERIVPLCATRVLLD